MGFGVPIPDPGSARFRARLPRVFPLLWRKSCTYLAERPVFVGFFVLLVPAWRVFVTGHALSLRVCQAKTFQVFGIGRRAALGTALDGAGGLGHRLQVRADERIGVPTGDMNYEFIGEKVSFRRLPQELDQALRQDAPANGQIGWWPLQRQRFRVYLIMRTTFRTFILRVHAIKSP